MNQPVPLEGTTTLQANASTPRTFWHSFTVFSSPFEKFCVQRGYLILLGLFAIEFVTALITDLARGSSLYNDTWIYLQYQNFHTSFVYHILIYSISIAGLMLTLGLGNRWQWSIPEFFQTLEQRCRLADPQLGVEKSYQTYLEEYRRALLYGRGRVLTRTVVIGVVVLCISIILVLRFNSLDIPYIGRLAAGNGIIVFMQSPSNLVEDVFFPLFLMYLTTSFIWMMGTTGLYIRRFAKNDWLRIQLTHPDNCGGFKFLGDFALNMALFILATATLVVFYIIEDYSWDGFSPWSIGASVLLIFLLVSSYVVFLQPIFAVHQTMAKERRLYEDAVARHTAKLEEQINAALREGDTNLLKTAKEGLEVAQTLHPDEAGLPSWPFNGRILIAFFSSQLIPIIGFAAGLIPTVSGILASFQHH